MTAAGGDSKSDETVRMDSEETPSSGSVLVVGSGFASAYPLPASGDVIIGRSDTADFQVQDGSVSRQHVKLSLGEHISVTDLGSANGTRIGDERLEPGVPRSLRAGESVELGAVTMLVRPRAAAPPGAQTLCTRDHFDQELERRCALTGPRAVPFALLRVIAEGASAAIRHALIHELRSTDLITQDAPDAHLVLLGDLAPTEALVIHERLRAHVMDRVRGARVTVACFPDDGTDPAALRRAAETDAADATDSRVVIDDDRMRELHALVDRVAPNPISVLLLGETGVGKEVFAQRIHDRSDRASEPMLRLNCAALSESLLEAELFGYEKGAFTGAAGAKPGLLETAHGGTVFLDEIGDLSPALQAKLLRVLEDGEVRRIGGIAARTIDVRVVAATNRDLAADSASGRFRSDLYYRLNGITIDIPPLRERTGEIIPLATAFIARACERARRPPVGLAEDAWRALVAYAWPGNVRELRNVVERAVLLCTGDTIGARHLPASLSPARRPVLEPQRGDDDVGATLEFERESPTMSVDRDAMDKAALIDALERCNGNQTRAARLLGIARSTLVKRIEKYNLPRPRKDNEPS